MGGKGGPTELIRQRAIIALANRALCRQERYTQRREQGGRKIGDLYERNSLKRKRNIQKLERELSLACKRGNSYLRESSARQETTFGNKISAGRTRGGGGWGRVGSKGEGKISKRNGVVFVRKEGTHSKKEIFLLQSRASIRVSDNKERRRPRGGRGVQAKVPMKTERGVGDLCLNEKRATR